MITRASSRRRRWILAAALTLALAPMVRVSAADRSHPRRLQPPTAVERDTLHVKFTAGTEVSTDGKRFTDAGGQDAAAIEQLNRVLREAGDFTIESLAPYQAYDDPVAASMTGYYRLEAAAPLDLDKTINAIQDVTVVEEAYAAPKPTPIRTVPPIPTPIAPPPPAVPATPDFTALQRYAGPAPAGIGGAAVANFPGRKGGYVKLVDIEYSWNINHEDLAKEAPSALVPNGVLVDPFDDSNHGTAVIGITSGDANGFGVTGIVPNADLKLINSNTDRGWELTKALQLAGTITKAGDVILIEQQLAGPNGSLVPVEWFPEWYNAIKALTATGRIVIEAAGNGGNNLDTLDDPTSVSWRNKPDSGAIIVGAGAAPGGGTCPDTGLPLRTRLGFSNYGRRVNVQGPGNCVATTGYGDLTPTAGPNAIYTEFFSGTSSASPVVAGVAAAVSSAHLALNKVPLSPDEMRAILVETGTKQDAGAIAAGPIGPLPHLGNAVFRTDKTAPTKPGTLSAKLNSTGKALLRWGASTDNVAIARYQIFRNGTLYKTATTTAFTDTGAKRGTTYRYKVRAVDTSGRLSTFSNEVTIKSK